MQQHTRPVRARTTPPQRSVTRPSSFRSPVRERLDASGARRHEARPQGLVVDVRHDLPRPRVEVAGELDLESAGLLTAMLEHVRRSGRPAGTVDPHHGEVDVDLTGVTFADSHGIAPVLDSPTRIVATSEPVRRLLDLLHEPSPAPEGQQPRRA